MKKAIWLAAALLAVIALVAVAGCGDDDDGDGGGDAAMQTDGAFVTEMTAHHEAAIEMAEMAQSSAQHAEVRELADEIVTAQTDEIDAMEQMHQRMFGESMMDGDHGSMGMAAGEMGMDMDMSALADARPFDRAFIDAMIAHHQGAIRMARVELEQGDDDEVMGMAEAIIGAQSSEIEQMNEWRKRWYGSESPHGGIPDEDMAMPGHDEMGH